MRTRSRAFSPPRCSKRSTIAAKDVLGLTVPWNTDRTVYYDNPCLRNGSAASAVAAAAQPRADEPGHAQPLSRVPGACPIQVESPFQRKLESHFFDAPEGKEFRASLE
jgi:hypothetical protein